jgi:uncharacterized protein GlcG (DUF336 family)
MTTLKLETALAIARAVINRGRETGLKPLTVAVLDDGGHIKALLRDDGSSLLRERIAVAKAHGALGLGLGSRAIGAMAEERPHFVASLSALAGGNLVPVAGGVLMKDSADALIGAVGVTGDTSDNDEGCAVHAINEAGLTPVTG